MFEPQALPHLDPTLVVTHILKDIEETIESLEAVNVETSSTVSTHFALEFGLYLGLRLPELAEQVKEAHAKIWAHAADQNVEQVEMMIQQTIDLILQRAHDQELRERNAV